jgi:hypothetical protein
VDPDHLKMELPKLREMGVDLATVEDGVRVRVEDPADLGSVNVSTLPFPGFATDLQAQMMVLMTQPPTPASSPRTSTRTACRSPRSSTAWARHRPLRRVTGRW